MVALNGPNLYEPQYQLQGWYDDSSRVLASWFDRDIAGWLATDTTGTVIPLVQAEVPFFVNENIIFTPPPITVEVLPPFFVNENIFFVPVAARIVGRPDQMIKNEVRRRR